MIDYSEESPLEILKFKGGMALVAALPPTCHVFIGGHLYEVD